MRPQVFPSALTASAGHATSSAAARTTRFVLDHFLLFVFGAVAGLVWANTAAESYYTFAHGASFIVNDIAMALFFGLLTQEIVEELMPGGGLHTWRRWAVPVTAAVGGTIAAPVVSLSYFGLKYETMLAQAWPVACAVDVVAAYYVLKIIRPRRGVLAFGLLTAFVANGLSMLAIALRTPLTGMRPTGLVLMIAAFVVAAMLRRRRVTWFWPYLVVCGVASWVGCYFAGIHPAFALIPIVPFMPHEKRTLNVFLETSDDDATHHVEHEWSNAVQIILFAFGLVNAGVALNAYGTGTWALMWAGLVGRPAGILLAVGVAMLVGLHLPPRVGWRDLIVIALATSSGFTLTLFSAVGILATGSLLGELKLGTLGLALGAVATLLAAAGLHIGRFARRRPHRISP